MNYNRLKSMFHTRSVSFASTRLLNYQTLFGQESQAARPAIEALMWPRRTVMDLVRVTKHS